MTVEELMPEGRFTQPQLELLRMFAKQYPDKVWLEIKDLVSKYFMDKATEEMDHLFEQKGWGDDKLNEWASGHMRTHYGS